MNGQRLALGIVNVRAAIAFVDSVNHLRVAGAHFASVSGKPLDSVGAYVAILLATFWWFYCQDRESVKA